MEAKELILKELYRLQAERLQQLYQQGQNQAKELERCNREWNAINKVLKEIEGKQDANIPNLPNLASSINTGTYILSELAGRDGFFLWIQNTLTGEAMECSRAKIDRLLDDFFTKEF